MTTATEPKPLTAEEIRAHFEDQKKRGEVFGDEAKKINERLLVVEQAMAAHKNLPALRAGSKLEGFARYRSAMWGVLTNDWQGAEEIRDLCIEATQRYAENLSLFGGKRIATANQDSSLGYLIDPQISPEVLDLYRSRLVLTTLGMGEINNLVGAPFIMNKGTADPTGAWIGEGANNTTTTEPTVGQVTAYPRQCRVLSEASNMLLQLSGSAAGVIERTQAEVLARLCQTAVLEGTGTSSQPLGILNHPDVQTVATAADGDDVDIDWLIDMVRRLDVANVPYDGRGWALAPRMAATLWKAKEGGGPPDPT